MSYDDGWAAIHLQMPKRVPRTEYSIEGHWDVLRAVTGIEVRLDSPEDLKKKARDAFVRAWNFDFFWSVMIGNQYLGKWVTDMGHAEYAAGGVDRRDTVSCPFSDPEDVLAFDPMASLDKLDKEKLRQEFEAHY